MKTLALALLLLTSSAQVLAAQPAPVPASPAGKGSLTGTVRETGAQQPVAFATVALLSTATGKPVDGTTTDEQGHFTLRRIAPGSYALQVSFVGFRELTSPGLVFTTQGEALTLGDVLLAAAPAQLGEVVVQGRRAQVEEKVDRTVYHADQDQTTRGGDATDVLRRVPLLSVDLDGNVSLRGASNVKVLIDNKPSTIAANSVADALRQLPADQIKAVEVITAPSARYDAEGAGGIINIVTRKNSQPGKTLEVRLGSGLRSSDLSVNGGYRTGRMNFSLGGSGRASYNMPGRFANSQLTTNPTTGNQTRTLQQAATRGDNVIARYSLGWDYDLNAHNALSASAQVGVRNFTTQQDGLLTQTLRGEERRSNLRDVTLTDNSTTLDLGLTYTHLFAQPQHEFNLLTLYSRTNAANDFTSHQLDGPDHAVTSRLRNDNDSYNQEVTVQADYQRPLGTTQLLEAGGKDIVRRVRSDYAYLAAAGAEGDYQLLTGENLTNRFTYLQNVAAGYVAYTASLPENYSLKAGVRYEHTAIEADFQTGQAVPLPAYDVLVPSLNLARKLGSGNVLKAAFNRRIQRPSLQLLNPNVQAANPLNVTQGNPLLQPEYSSNYELAYSTTVKSVSLSGSLFARTTTGAIQSVRTVAGDTIRTSYANLGRRDAYGANVFFNVNVKNKLTLSGGPDLYYAVLANRVADPLLSARNQGWVLSGRLSGSYNVTKNWDVQFFGFFKGRQVQLQGDRSGFYLYSLSVKRDLWNHQGSLGVGADNFFSPTYRQRTELASPLLTQSSVTEMRMQGFRVNFSYRLGKSGAPNPPRRKKTISNDDLKGGSDS